MVGAEHVTNTMNASCTREVNSNPDSSGFHTGACTDAFSYLSEKCAQLNDENILVHGHGQVYSLRVLVGQRETRVKLRSCPLSRV